MLEIVTITGADDFVEPQDLVALSEEFPFVEWGILLNKSKEGLNPRFPSKSWMAELHECAMKSKVSVALAGHLWGAWVRNLAVKLDNSVFDERPEFLEHFSRIQLNFSCYDVAPNMLEILPEHHFIFQIGNRGITDKIKLAKTGKHSILFDRSGGKGISPNEWPDVIEDVWCGYAGGLGPENLNEQIPKIIDVAEIPVGLHEMGNPFWLDMEAKVRTDEKFDLKKVRESLEICKPWVNIS